MSSAEFRKVNNTLDKEPNIGPFPADQVFPWSVIALVAYLLGNLVLGLPWVWTILLGVWGIATWWILTVYNSYWFFAKFIDPPHWIRSLRSKSEFRMQNASVLNSKF